MIEIAFSEIANRSSDELTDTTPPVIELIGGDTITVAVDGFFEEPRFFAYDDASIPVVTIENNVDISKEGEYDISYTATDDSGNTTHAERVIKVIQPAGRIYLTFDDGPSDYTSKLLDILSSNGVKATFFVTGYGDDALIRREFDEGHAIGLHSMSHIYSQIYTNKESYWADLNAVQDRVKRITGQPTSIIRFPGGSSNLVSAIYDDGQRIMSSLVEEVSGRGFTYFDWNVDSGDAGDATTADSVYNNVIKSLGVGGEYVVLQHDIKPYSVEAVERIIKYGLENGFVFSKLREGSFTAHHGVNN